MTNSITFGRIECDKCGKNIDTPAEVASLSTVLCPECDTPRSEEQTQSVSVMVTAPESIKGAT